MRFQSVNAVSYYYTFARFFGGLKLCAEKPEAV